MTVATNFYVKQISYAIWYCFVDESHGDKPFEWHCPLAKFIIIIIYRKAVMVMVGHYFSGNEQIQRAETHSICSKQYGSIMKSQYNFIRLFPYLFNIIRSCKFYYIVLCGQHIGIN